MTAAARATATPRTTVLALVIWLVAVGLAAERAEAGDAELDQPAARADSIEALQAAWEQAPTDIGRGIRLHDALIQAGRQRAAESLFRRKLKELGGDPAVSFLYGRAKGGTRGIAAMRTALDKRLGRKLGDASGLLDAWIAMAVAEVQTGEAGRAEHAAQQVTSLRGLAADWTYLGWIQERLQKNPEAAERSYTLALKKDEAHLPARNALALMKAAAGDIKAATALARGSVERHGTSASAHLHLGLLLAMAGADEEAREAYARALRCAQGSADDLAAVATAYMEIEEHALAASAIEHALAINAKHGRALVNAGMLALEKSEWKSARAYLQRAAKALPRDAHVHFLRGVCAQRMGMHSSAISAFRKATGLEPGRVDYVTALALAYIKKGSLPSAVMLLKRAIKAAPADADLRLQLGIALLRQRKFKLARDAFIAAAEREPKDARPHFYLAILYGDKLNEPKEALAALEEYKRLGGNEPTALTWLKDLRARYK